MGWMTEEMERILAIPDDERTAAEGWTERLRVEGGQWSVLDHQAIALQYAKEGCGLFLPISVGGGKTILSMLLPGALDVDPAETLVLCPAALRDEAEREREIYRHHFDVPALQYVSYSQISNDHTLLEEIAPRLIIADEAHKLKRTSKRSGRLNRFLKYLVGRRDEIQFVPMSATFTNSSIHEYAHLAVAALGDNCFLPKTSWVELNAWARCLDVSHQMPATKEDWAKMGPLVDKYTTEDEGSLRERARLAFGRRMASTPGVVVMDASSCDQPIYIEGRKIDPGEIVKEAVKEAREYFLPNGDIIGSQLERANKLDQLSAGFYYFWDWPDGEPDLDWVYARRDYNKAVSQFVKTGRKGLDTDGLVEKALIEGDERVMKYYDLRTAWEVWKQERHKPEPPRGSVWISEEPLRAAMAIAEELDALLWYDFEEEADKLEELGMRVFRAGERPTGSGPVAVSTYAHATGLNLQTEWSQNVLIHMTSNAGKLEQLIGRTHRLGQESAVGVVYVISISEARKRFRKAVEKARYIETTQKIPQKLLLALDADGNSA